MNFFKLNIHILKLFFLGGWGGEWRCEVSGWGGGLE